ncbi:ankyrin repeat-containing protein BDA1 [Ziziphus jujuba]|uniref:Ankyrin repeat-containing protein BDA1 n=1 Tax=Ziziphus jujuba TaxID=326968 RepID=A0ABM4A2V5_ZIZJJ|nr:ankyrin repeat-containing protein BDA1 [Ziziphus jujuba]
MEENLKTAAQNGDMNMLYTLLGEDPYVLDRIDDIPFVDTPLHVAACFGHVQGREGKTPLHYVVEQGDVDLLTEFLSACPQSIQDVTIQNETALYIAVKNDKVNALDFLLGGLRQACYQGSDIQERKIINWKDDEGNTVLHVATAMNQPKAVRLLLSSNIEVNVKNSMGLTALDISDPNNGQVRET